MNYKIINRKDAGQLSVLGNCLVFLHNRVAIPQRTKMECVYRRMIKGYA